MSNIKKDTIDKHINIAEDVAMQERYGISVGTIIQSANDSKTSGIPVNFNPHNMADVALIVDPGTRFEKVMSVKDFARGAYNDGAARQQTKSSSEVGNNKQSRLQDGNFDLFSVDTPMPSGDLSTATVPSVTATVKEIMWKRIPVYFVVTGIGSVKAVFNDVLQLDNHVVFVIRSADSSIIKYWPSDIMAEKYVCDIPSQNKLLALSNNPVLFSYDGVQFCVVPFDAELPADTVKITWR